MRAAVLTSYGGPELLKVMDVKRPEPTDEQVLIRVKEAVVTPTDCVFGKGSPVVSRVFTGLIRPRKKIPGEIFGGIVEKTGSNVTGFKPGDRVYGSAGMKLGAYAEYICIGENSAIVKKPDRLQYGTAAGICDGGLTAYGFLKGLIDIKKDQKIMIIGASGSVGSHAVQLSNYFGAEVTGVCSTKHIELVRSLGAVHVIDYTKTDITGGNGKYDVIFDVAAKSSFAKCKKNLKENGVYMTTFPTPDILMHRLFRSKYKGKQALFAATGLKKNPEKRQILERLNEMAESGAIEEVVDKRYELQDIAEAFRYVGKGHKTGNVIISI